MAAPGFEALQHLSNVINDSFPSMQYTICYGSVAFPQIKPEQEESKTESITDNDTEKTANASFFDSLSLSKIVPTHYIYKLNEPMLDFIFIVNDSKQWHSQNLSTSNYYHYSTLLRLFGAPFVSYFQCLGPGVLHNPFICVSNCNMMIKYGVITTSQLVQDLVYWRSLYIAGRLHKPVLFLNHNQSNDIAHCDRNHLDTFYGTIDDTEDILFEASQLNDALSLNLDYAMRVSLILLSGNQDTFTLKELFTTIASLSYCGDIRNKYAEDINKYEKIVNGSYAQFVEMYDMFLTHYIESIDSDRYALKQGVTVEYLCERLPHNLWNEMVKMDADIRHHLDDKHRVCACMQYALCTIVKEASWIQGIKGFVSAGFVNSFWYLLRKMNKYYTSINEVDAQSNLCPNVQTV